jgi:hypothetical protein
MHRRLKFRQFHIVSVAANLPLTTMIVELRPRGTPANRIAHPRYATAGVSRLIAVLFRRWWLAHCIIAQIDAHLNPALSFAHIHTWLDCSAEFPTKYQSSYLHRPRILTTIFCISTVNR